MAEKISVDRLRQLTEDILVNEDNIQNLTLDELVALRNFTDPIGAGNVKKSGEELFANISITNWSESYLRKLIMTALVGYIYRTAAEYVPGEIDEEDKKFRAACEKSPGRIKELTEAHNKKTAAITAETRAVVTKFLNRNFNFNPDQHLRTAHTTNKKDPERRDKLEMIHNICTVKIPAARVNEEKMKQKQDRTFDYIKEKLLGLTQAIVQSATAVRNCIKILKSEGKEHLVGILQNNYQYLLDLEADIKKLSEPILSAETLEALQIAPPVDVFHQFDRFLSNHYEQLREITEALYHVKPDIEHSITLHSVSTSAEDARQYRIQHENDFQNEILEISSGCINILGPFRQNRERVDFYNKNTEILKLMASQVESDHKLGADFMAKSKLNAKKKNITQAGPDNPALKNYIQNLNQARELGVQPSMSIEDQQRYAELNAMARDIKEDYETPDDAIRMEVFKPKENEDGTLTLTRGLMYTQAEKPLHMEENSEFINKYQPVKSDSGPTIKESSQIKNSYL